MIDDAIATVTVAPSAGPSAASRRPPHRPPHRRHRLQRRTRWWTELLLVLAIYAAYDLTRDLRHSSTAAAYRHGRLILRWEHDAHLGIEHPLNQALAHLPVLAVIASYWYAALHFLVTATVLVWLYRAHPDSYRRARTWLASATVTALVGFWLFPVAPPRLLPGSGIRDTLADVHQWGWWSGQTSTPSGTGHLVNEYAAMPSLHVAWALWSGWLIARHARHRSVRLLGAAYPILTTLVVLSTGNHYLADALAGAALIVITGAATALWTRRERDTATVLDTRPARHIPVPVRCTHPQPNPDRVSPLRARRLRQRAPAIVVTADMTDRR